MKGRTRFFARATILAALYAAMTFLQNLLLPGTAGLAIQLRVSEALCVLALFTPAAIPGLSAGCLLYNITFAHTLPTDFLVGTAATFLSVGGMYLTRRVTVRGYPLLAMLLPAMINGIMIGWELSFYIGGAFLFNALCVAAGEAIVLLTFGSALWYAIRVRHLDSFL